MGEEDLGWDLAGIGFVIGILIQAEDAFHVNMNGADAATKEAKRGLICMTHTVLKIEVQTKQTPLCRSFC